MNTDDTRTEPADARHRCGEDIDLDWMDDDDDLRISYYAVDCHSCGHEDVMIVHRDSNDHPQDPAVFYTHPGWEATP